MPARAFWGTKSEASQSMAGEPLTKVVAVCFSRRHVQNDAYKLTVGIFKLYIVERKKNKHTVRPCAFIAVDERVVFYDAEAKPRRF